LPGKRESLPYLAVMLAGTRDLMIQAKPLKIVDADSGGSGLQFNCELLGLLLIRQTNGFSRESDLRRKLWAKRGFGRRKIYDLQIRPVNRGKYQTTD
jgi:hypothetical protein